MWYERQVMWMKERRWIEKQGVSNTEKQGKSVNCRKERSGPNFVAFGPEKDYRDDGIGAAMWPNCGRNLCIFYANHFSNTIK